MYISTTHSAFTKWTKDDKKAIKIVADAGFTAYDFAITKKQVLSGDYIAYAKSIREYADSLSLPCNQTHAPYPSILNGSYPLWEVGVYARDNDIQTEDFAEFNKKVRERIIMALKFSEILGAKVCVVHPGIRSTEEENAEFYLSLADVARETGVKIGVENAYDWKENDPTASPAACSDHIRIKSLLDRLPEDVFVACIDIGHASLQGLDTSPAQMIESLGKRVGALHIHDVDLINDNHAIPFSLKVDYNPVIAALKKTGYKGDITLEADPWSGLPEELIPSVARYMADIAGYFRNELNKNK